MFWGQLWDHKTQAQEGEQQLQLPRRLLGDVDSRLALETENGVGRRPHLATSPTRHNGIAIIYQQVFMFGKELLAMKGLSHLGGPTLEYKRVSGRKFMGLRNCENSFLTFGIEDPMSRLGAT